MAEHHMHSKLETSYCDNQAASAGRSCGEQAVRQIQRRAVSVDGASRAIFSPMKARVPLPLPGGGRKQFGRIS